MILKCLVRTGLQLYCFADISSVLRLVMDWKDGDAECCAVGCPFVFCVSGTSECSGPYKVAQGAVRK